MEPKRVEWLVVDTVETYLKVGDTIMAWGSGRQARNQEWGRIGNEFLTF